MLHSAENAGAIELQEMTEQQVESCVIKGITGSKLKPALARIQWRKKKGKPVPEYDYPVNDILAGSPKTTHWLSVIKYRMSMWVRTGWKRRFLENHPHAMEKVGHLLYKFPSSIPGWGALVYLKKKIGK